jgi:hypothetical protein
MPCERAGCDKSRAAQKFSFDRFQSRCCSPRFTGASRNTGQRSALPRRFLPLPFEADTTGMSAGPVVYNSCCFHHHMENNRG